jgi:hypothetical protein
VSLPPWLVLSGVLCLIIALLYQLFSRRYGWRVIGYWIAVMVGFIGAEVLAEATGISLFRVGDLRLLPDILGAAIVVAVLWFLGL